MFINNCPFGWKSEGLNPKQKKAPGGKIGGNRPARVWWMGNKVINVNKFFIGCNTKFYLFL